MSLSSPTSACSSSRCYSSGLSLPIGLRSSPINVGLVSYPRRHTNAPRNLVIASSSSSSSSSSDPLLVKAAKGQAVSRPPAWMMRQAGRYMSVYKKLAQKHPSFRERSENTDLIVEISLQPWQAFKPDGVIIFSDILTPLPAFGVPFDIEEVRGPVIQSPIRTEDDLKKLHPIDLDKLRFVGDSLKILRGEVGEDAAVLGFVGAPWTIATYIVEGGTTRTYTVIKSMCHTAPNVLRALLSHLTKAITEYVVYQVEHGAHCIQIFDSWGGQLTPEMWERWSKPYIEEIIHEVKKKHQIMATVKLSLSSPSPSSIQSKLSAASFIPSASRAFNATAKASKSRFIGKCLRSSPMTIHRGPRSVEITCSASSSPAATLPSALLFDCDGVLVDTEKDGHRISFNDTFKERDLGVTWDVDLYGELLKIGGGKERMTAYFNKVGWPEKAPKDEAERKAFIAGLHKQKTELFMVLIEKKLLPLRPGVAKLVDQALTNGVKVAVCSTSNEKAVSAIVSCLLGPERAENIKIFAGDVVPKKKPDPAIYNLAAETLGVDPSKCVVVEDSAIGLAAAKAAGMTCIVTKSGYTADEDFVNADAVFDCIGDPPEERFDLSFCGSLLQKQFVS